jgi:hypothetical protein
MSLFVEILIFFASYDLGKKLEQLKKVTTSTRMSVFLMPIHLYSRSSTQKNYRQTQRLTEGKLKGVVRVREKGTDDGIGTNPETLTISICQNRNGPGRTCQPRKCTGIEIPVPMLYIPAVWSSAADPGTASP